MALPSRRRQQSLNELKHWWQEETASARAHAAWGTSEALKRAQSSRVSQHTHFSCLYGVRNINGISHFGPIGSIEPIKRRSAYNVVRQVIDTRKAKVTKNRPRPYFVTNGGDWKQRRLSKKLNKFAQGLFYECQFHEKSPDVYRDADIGGTGVLKVYRDNGRVCIERVLATTIYVDEAEAINGDPRQLYQSHAVAREVLLADPRFKGVEQQKAIESAATMRLPVSYGLRGEMIEVREGWHLPSRKDKGDGKHIVFVGGKTQRGGGELLCEPYEHDCFPFAFLHRAKPVVGFWGQGMAELLDGYQLDINRLNWRIMEHIKKHSVPRLIIPRQTKITKDQISNRMDEALEVEGAEGPFYMQPSFVPSEYFEERRSLILGAYQEGRVSEMDVAATKPAGLNSAPALREYEDAKNEGLIPELQAYEQFALDVIRLMFNEVRAIAESETDGKKRGYRVRYTDRRQVEELDWKDIDLAEEEYVLQVYPTSSLPSTPSARKDTLVEWMQLGLINGAEFRRMMDVPDLEQSTNLAASSLDDADWTVGQVLDEGKRLMPEPEQDLQALLDYALASYRRARQEGYPPDHIDNLLELIANTQAMIDTAMQGAKQAASSGEPPPAPGMEAPPQMAGPMQQQLAAA